MSARISDLRRIHGFDITSELEVVPAPKNRTGKAEVSRYTLEDTLKNRRKLKKLDASIQHNRKPLKKAA